MIVYVLYVVRAVCKDVDALFRGVDRVEKPLLRSRDLSYYIETVIIRRCKPSLCVVHAPAAEW